MSMPGRTPLVGDAGMAGGPVAHAIAGADHGRRRALLAIAAAGVLAGVVGAPAAAQSARAGVSTPVAATPAEELQRVSSQAEASRVRLERYVASLAGRPASAAVLDSLAAMRQSLAVLERRLEFMRERASFRQLEARLDRGGSEPRGWFGVDVQTLGTSTAQSDGRVLVSADYPRVVSVEPGSPAARAGLAAGDRLISIRGTDLRGQALDLRSVLRPGTRVPVRLERDGVRRDVTVAITVRPSSFSPGTRVRLFAVSPDARVDDGGGYAVVASGAMPRPDAMQSLTTTRVWRSEVAAPNPITYLFRASPSVLAVAGAELMRVTGALRASLGVGGGVYVISVAPRTPAEWAGVREGDVIQRADGMAVEAPVDFFRVMQEQTDGLVKLDLVRARRPLSVELRW